jgi:hypothetical protein
MFEFVDILQGPSTGAIDSDEDGSDAKSTDQRDRKDAEEAGRFSLWGMATALAENVKKSTAEIAAR